MAHRFPLPDDADLEKMIGQAFDIQYRPESERINRIEEHLLHKIKRRKPENNLNKIPWWIVLILTGGFATAAWWAGDKLFNVDREIKMNKEMNSRSIDSIMKPESKNIDEKIKIEGKIQKNDVIQENDSPIIYQREQF